MSESSTGRHKWEFSTVPSAGIRFVALYADGSGGDVFYKNPWGKVFDANGVDLFDGPIDNDALADWLLDSGYMFWRALPEGMKLFFEQQGEKSLGS